MKNTTDLAKLDFSDNDVMKTSNSYKINLTKSKSFVYIPKKSKRGYLISKRTFDLVLSVLGLIILSPLLLIIAAAIKLDSPGKAIYAHNRLGKNGKIFKMYKFRSMVSNSAEIFDNFSPEQKKAFEENYKLDNDPRITRLGKFIRKTSLDELPQLVNIIKGDLSIVGPRPLVEKEIEKYGIHKNKFLSISPGLTGYWQVNGRSTTTYQDRINMELYYVDNYSFLLDAKILFKTAGAVLSRRGAK